MEYIVIIAVGALLATILQNVVQSEPVQEAIVEKIRCVILSSGEGCTDPQTASGDTKPTANDDPPPVNYNNPDLPPIPSVPPQPQVQVTSQKQDLEQPWYQCLLSLDCMKKKAGEAVDEITGFFVRYMEDLEKEALQHCGQDAECIFKYKLKKRISLALHFNPGLGLLSLGIEKLTGWSLLDTVADYIVENPIEAAFIALCIVLIPFTGGTSAAAGAAGTGATGSVLGGLGAAGIAFLGRRLAIRFFPRIAAWLASRIPLPPWAVRFLPLGMEGGFTATAEAGWFDFIRDGKINWKKALINGLLGAGIGFAAPIITPYVVDGIGIGLKQIRQLPVAFEVTPDGAILAKRLGDTEIGQKLEDAGDALRRFAGSGDEAATITKDEAIRAAQNYELKVITEIEDGKPVRYVLTTFNKKVKIKNGDLAGKKHPITGVPFDSNGFPDFTNWQKGPDIYIDKSLCLEKDHVHFKEATKILKKYLQENPDLKKQFTDEQLEAIYKEKANIPGLSWHHHQEPGKMQLVLRDVHRKTGHTGGREIWGGGSKYR